MRLRLIYPKKSTCPQCASVDHEQAGRNREGTIQYRDCAACGARYKVFPIAAEDDDGGMVSVIKLL